MLLEQLDTAKNFYVLEKDYAKAGFFVYCSSESFNKKKFDLSKAFSDSEYSFPFLIVFSLAPALDTSFSTRLQNELRKERKMIIWLDEFTTASLSKSGKITVNVNNTFDNFDAVGIDGREYTFGFENLNAGGGAVTFDTTINSLRVKSRNRLFSFIAGGRDGIGSDRKANIEEFLVPFQNADKIIDYQTAVSSNKGAIIFKSRSHGALALQPSSPLIVDFENKEEFTYFDYFDNESFRNNVDLYGTFFPYRNITNSEDSHTGYFEFKAKDKVNTNFVSTSGGNFYADNLSQLICQIGYIKKEGSERIGGTFFPKNNAKLGLRSYDKNESLLLGYSGTEAASKTSSLEDDKIPAFEITFKTDERKVKVLPAKEVYFSACDGSVTSLPVFSAANGQLTYFLDSERVPLFANKAISGYTHQPFGNLKLDNVVPLIPTLSHRNRTDKDTKIIKSVEKVFSRYRKSNNRESTGETLNLFEGEKKQITPQGFLKEGNKLNFIKTVKVQSFDENKVSEKTLRFQVDLRKNAGKSVDASFQLSLSKEDVFFVLTPKLLKEAAAQVSFNSELDILFELAGFDINLQSLKSDDDQPATHKEKIIIFKFCKKSFDQMLADPTSWSNDGIYETTSLRKAAKEAIDEYLNKLDYNRRNPQDYQYLEKIRTDPNWNGIVVLNIPIIGEEDKAGGEPKKNKKSGLPPIFEGLGASQQLQPEEKASDKLKFKENLKFQFIAFPVNKTFITGTGVDIDATSFYGLIDYNILRDEPRDGQPPADGTDYKTAHRFFKPNEKPEKFQFLLSKLLVRFDNSAIANFKSYAFIQVPNLFEDSIEITSIKLSNNDKPQTPKPYELKNLVRMDGHYQKNKAGKDEFNFGFSGNIAAIFSEGCILKSIDLTKATFTYVAESNQEYRFDFNGSVKFNPNLDYTKSIISFNKLDFQNMGFKFNLDGGLPKLEFDASNLIPLPDIKFNGAGFLSSFPIKLNRFQIFKFLETDKFDEQNFDFLPIFNNKANSPSKALLWGFIFDFDLGTLGDLGLLKALKGELLLGWTAGGGFKLGLKLDKPSSDGLHLDLFGALKLDIDKVGLCSFPDSASDSKHYMLFLKNIRLSVFGKKLPPGNDEFSGLIFADPSNPEPAKRKIAWFITYVDKDNAGNKRLSLGIGQHVGSNAESVNSVKQGVENLRKDIFKDNIDPCATNNSALSSFRKPDRNWLVASENALPEAWAKILDLRILFNDPVLYGIYLGLKGDGAFRGFSIDILYKKISDNLGVWALEIQLPDAIRNQEMGGAAITLPNFGVEIFTNGDWKLDIGFPRGDDWSRSGFLQIRTPIPFVGWAGFYLLRANIVSQTIFNGKLGDRDVSILQAGFALRVGVGVYFKKGILSAGASISVYGILEGAFAFDKKKQDGLQQFFPDHFALFGRVGAIAEIVGYVDFGIVKASIAVTQQVEVGLLLIMVEGKLLPAPLYIEGRVRVAVTVTIRCFKIFRKQICIRIRFSFEASIRFEYTIGGSSSNSFSLLESAGAKLLGENNLSERTIDITGVGDVPVSYIPTLTKTNEAPDSLRLVHYFAIPFFGTSTRKASEDEQEDEHKVIFSKKNLFSEKIVKVLFEKLTAAGISQKYEDLIQVLRDGKLDGQKVRLTFSDFRPWFIQGLDIGAPSSDVVLENTFKFDKEEIKTLRSVPQPCDVSSADDKGKCIFRMIPVPVASKIIVGDGINNTEFDAGFKIEIENIAEVKLDADIDAIAYNDEHLDALEEWFSSYKTQYLARSEDENLRLEFIASPDLRNDFIIPEYFKLIGLLTLEAYHNACLEKLKDIEKKLEDEGRENEREAYTNPTVEAAKISSTDANVNWDLNGKLEDIIGKLSYFYVNGLRLPGSPQTSTETSAYFDFIKQTYPKAAGDAPFKKASAASWNDAKVTIKDKKNPAKNVDLTAEVFPDKEADVKNFKAQITRQESVNLEAVRSSFIKKDSAEKTNQYSKIISQYELLPVTLAVQNSKSTKEQTFRFFEMPGKIAAQSQSDDRFKLRLKLAERTNKEPEKKYTNVANNSFICANVQMKARPYLVREGKSKILELTNVFIDDLTLMRNVFTDTNKFLSQVGKIKFYKKEGDSFSEISGGKTLIVKTNLSTKTHPPLIDTSSFNFMEEEKNEVFIAADDDKEAFSKLLWEGLTTNNGGYFILFEKDGAPVADGKNDPIDLIVSFEMKKLEPVSEKFPAFCNYIRIENKKIESEKSLFDKLDENSHYLFIELLSAADDSPIKEFHSKIPAHCLGFEIWRQKNKPEGEEYSQYLPLEFEVSSGGSSILSREEILPLMPSQSENVADKIFYKHVSPVIKYSDKEAEDDTVAIGPADKSRLIRKNLKRYDAVGQTFEFKFGVRDAYGFRAASGFTLFEPHKQLYFDKLVPIEAWSLIQFSYWLKDETTPQEFKWELKATIDLSKLPGLLGLSQKNGGLNSDGSVNKNFLGDDSVIENIHSVLRSLYTVQAQLKGPGITVEIAKDSKNAREFLAQIVDETIKRVIEFSKNGSLFKGALTRLINLPAPGELRKKLEISISIKRDKNLCVDEQNAWDARAIKESLYHVSPENLNNAEPVNLLHSKVHEKTGGRYGLGIGSDDDKRKAIYLINQKTLQEIQVDGKLLNAGKVKRERYFGIAPVSNRLWSGVYKSASPSGEVKEISFSNIDLDSSLKVVLAKIDSLLSPNFAGENLRKEVPSKPVEDNQKSFENLIEGKKKLVTSRLQEKLSSVDAGERPSPFMAHEFKNLIFERLSNFYNYDGMIALSIQNDINPETTPPEELNRLSISAGNIPNYNLAASKIGCFYNEKNKRLENSKECLILFDQLDYEPRLDTNLKNIELSVTHIEFGITKVEDSDVEASEWIQLVKPVKVTNKINVDDKWLRIVREFPSKPVLNSYRAKGEKEDIHQRWSRDLGKWTFELELDNTKSIKTVNNQTVIEPKYSDSDWINIGLNFQFNFMAEMMEQNSFEAFVAFWANEILQAEQSSPENFKWKNFAEELNSNAGLNFEAFSTESFTGSSVKFTLIKDGKFWKPKSNSSEGKYSILGEEREGSIFITIGGFNVLDREAITAVEAEVSIERNSEAAKNEEFVYRTEIVKTSSWTTPHLRFSNVIRLPADKKFDDLIRDDILPETNSGLGAQNASLFKSTAKWVLDVGKFEDSTLPIIPVKQMEFNEKPEPAGFDIIFADAVNLKYRNGFPAISLTIYSQNGKEQLPIFHAEIIKRA